ncbi:MAG: aconitate hydratase B, partial [Burkholderiaceae bacterium]
MADFLANYQAHVAERAAMGIPPLPLSAEQTAALIEALKVASADDAAELLNLLTHRVPPGVDDAAQVKASFLSAVAHGDVAVAALSRQRATELLGTMVGGYNVKPLIDLLDDDSVGEAAAQGLKHTLLMFDAFHDVADKAKAGHARAQAVLQSWADAEWFTSRPEVPPSLTVTVFK